MKKLALTSVFLMAVIWILTAQESSVRTEKIRLTVGDNKVREAHTLADWGIAKIPKYRALIIGVSEYKHASAGMKSLVEPVNDAQKLYDVLTAQYTFEPRDVIFLKNPTRSQIVDSLEVLAHITKPDENLLVFYAGHGTFDQKLDIGYWIPSDGVEGRKSSYLANSELRNYLKGIPSKHTLLISDACFGGSIFKEGRATYETMIRQFNDYYKVRSRKALTSGYLQVVNDKSVFMEYLLKILKENEKPFIAAVSLYTQIYDPIQNNSTTLPQYGAIQDAGDDGVGGSFLFIRKIN